MDYAAVRNLLVKDRWVPIRHSEVQPLYHDRMIQRKYPELDSCAVDKPVCSFSFKKEGKCLRIITGGEYMKSFSVSTIAQDCLGNSVR